MGVAQAGGFCSDRDFVVIAPTCMFQCLYHWRSKSSIGDFDIFKSQGRKFLRGVGPFCESMHLLQVGLFRAYYYYGTLQVELFRAYYYKYYY